MGRISRGFRGRKTSEADASRLPPGQYRVDPDFPVLSAGPTPHTPLDEWTFSIVGEVAEPKEWSWQEFRALPSEEIRTDIHCVTKWSKLDTVLGGRLDRHAPRWSRARRHARARFLRRRLHDQRPA